MVDHPGFAAPIVSFLRTLNLALRRAALRRRGVKLGTGEIGPGVSVLPRNGRITIGPAYVLGHGVVLDAHGGSIELGARVFLGPYVVIYGHGGVTIGDDSLIAMHCRIVSSNHTVPPFATLIRSQPDLLQPTSIGRDVWLGAGVTVVAGVTIGDGCVVGAGAVVTTDLPPGSIAYGVPAVVKGRRVGAPRA
jgi:acetyltransferase-like isoleucine patch superfamily enzyme